MAHDHPIQLQNVEALNGKSLAKWHANAARCIVILAYFSL